MPPGVITTATDGNESIWAPGRPNILITGTPGVGKTTIARQVADELGLRHIDVGDFARERNHFAELDVERNAHLLHEDAVLDDLEPIMTDGAVVIDHHSCDWFPERWFQLAIVLRTSTEPLFDRLEGRGYSSSKIAENVEAEIMQVVFEETVTSYPKLEIMDLNNDDDADREQNISKIRSAWSRLRRSSDAEEETVDGQPA